MKTAAPGPVSIYDPLSGQPFPANRIPSSRVDSAALGLLKYTPLPNQPGTVRNCQFVTVFPNSYDTVNVNTSHTLKSRHHLSASISLQSNNGIWFQLMGFADTS